MLPGALPAAVPCVTNNTVTDTLARVQPIECGTLTSGADWMGMRSSGGPVGLSNSTLDLHSPSSRVSARSAPDYELPDCLRRRGHRAHPVTTNWGRRAPGSLQPWHCNAVACTPIPISPPFGHQISCTSSGVVRGATSRSLEPDRDNGRKQTLLSQRPAGQTGPNPRKHDRGPYSHQSASERSAPFIGSQTRWKTPRMVFGFGFRHHASLIIADALFLFVDVFRHFNNHVRLA
jgi:hypothetical protein